MQIHEAKRPALLPLVVALFGLIAVFHLGGAWVGKSLIRASHIGTALEYARGSINLLRPVIVGFNATGSPTAQEFPVWQAAAAVAFKLTHSTWYGWANLVSLLFFATGLYPFFRLARQYVGERAAGWAMAFFLAQPIIVVMSGEAATDGLCLVVMLWFLFCADTMIRTGNARWWWATTIFGILCALLKLPFFFLAGLFSMMLVAAQGGRALRPWVLLAGAGGVALIVFLIWTRYTDSLAAQALYSNTDLRVSHSPWLMNWFFGDLHYRLSPGHWIKGGWRFLHATLGALPLVMLLVLALVRGGNAMPKLWLLAMVLTTLVFTHLVLEHWHYYLPVCPAVAMLCGATLARWEDFWAQEMPIAALRIGLAGAVLVLAAIDGVITMKVAMDYDYFPAEMSAVIRQHTAPTDRLVLFTCDPNWGGEMLFRSDRKGLCVPIIRAQPNGPTPKGLVELLTNPDDLRQLKSLGYNKLVLVSESPVRFAVMAANPGAKRLREYYPDRISPQVDAWPEVLRSTDILIKSIP